MSKFIDQLGSSEWWISVVVVGILVNLASAVLQQRLSRIRQRVSERYRNAKTKEAEGRQAEIEALRIDNARMTRATRRLLSRRVGIVQLLLCAAFMLLLGLQLNSSQSGWAKIAGSIASVFGTIGGLSAMALDRKASKREDLIYEAEEGIRPNQAPLSTPMSVTDRADTRSEPATGVVEL